MAGQSSLALSLLVAGCASVAPTTANGGVGHAVYEEQLDGATRFLLRTIVDRGEGLDALAQAELDSKCEGHAEILEIEHFFVSCHGEEGCWYGPAARGLMRCAR